MLWALLLPLALILAVAVEFAFAGRSMLGVPRQYHTGDPLIDAYIQAKVEGCLQGKQDDVLLTPRKWEELEARFGGTARFALLCYTGRRQMSICYSQRPPAPMPKNEPPSYIYDAYKRGQYDLPLLITLYEQLEQDWWRELPPSSFGPTRTNFSMSEQDVAWQQQRRAVSRQHSAEELELLAKMQSAAPDEALPHYMQAIQASVKGDDRAARQALELGNAAPHCSVPAGPAFDPLIAAARQGQALGGDLAVVGVLQCDNTTLFGVFDLFHSFRLLASQAARTHDLALLSALNQACYRLGSADNSMMTRISIYDSLAALPDIFTAANQANLSPAQRGSLGEYKAKADQLPKLLSQWTGNTTQNLDSIMNAGKPFPYRIADRFTGGRASRIKAYRLMGQEFLDEQRFFDQQATPLLRDLQRFDFTTLSWRQP
jgi:hypothetical protein